MTFTIYCDGSTKGNGTNNSAGAWAYVVLAEVDGKEQIIHSGSGAETNTTNQRMELTAAIEALTHVTLVQLVLPFDRIIVNTDSAYLYNCFTQKWYKNWQMNDWKNSKKQPVANRDLWERLIYFFEMPEVEFVKVKGHAGVEYNEIVDKMAQDAAEELRRGL